MYCGAFVFGDFVISGWRFGMGVDLFYLPELPLYSGGIQKMQQFPFTIILILSSYSSLVAVPSIFKIWIVSFHLPKISWHLMNTSSFSTLYLTVVNVSSYMHYQIVEKYICIYYSLFLHYIYWSSKQLVRLCFSIDSGFRDSSQGL